MVADTGAKWSAALLAVFAYTLSNGVFNLSCFVAIRAMLRANGGVAVPMVGKKGRTFRRGGKGGEGGPEQEKKRGGGSTSRSRSRSRRRSRSRGRSVN